MIATVPTNAADLAAYMNVVNPSHQDVERWPWSDVGPDGYEFAISFGEQQDGEHIAGLLRYIFSGPLAMAGEFEGTYTEVIPGRLFIFDCDTTKSQRDDIGMAWDEASVMITEGTPIRKTDRAGAGTKGTRKYMGITGDYAIVWR